MIPRRLLLTAGLAWLILAIVGLIVVRGARTTPAPAPAAVTAAAIQIAAGVLVLLYAARVWSSSVAVGWALALISLSAFVAAIDSLRPAIPFLRYASLGMILAALVLILRSTARPSPAEPP